MPADQCTSQKRNAQTVSGIEMIRSGPLCTALGVHPDTLKRWVRQGKFPRPIYTSNDAPARWRVRDVEQWIERAKVKRRKRTPRGRLVSRMTPEERASRREVGRG